MTTARYTITISRFDFGKTLRDVKVQCFKSDLSLIVVPFGARIHGVEVSGEGDSVAEFVKFMDAYGKGRAQKA